MAETLSYPTSETIYNNVGRLSNSNEIEAAVLGAILIDKDALGLVQDIISTQSFYLEEHQIIYETMLEMYQAGEEVDAITLTQKLRSQQLIRKAGGARYIVGLTNEINSSSNIEFHAMIMAQSGIKREMMQTATEIISQGMQNEMDIFDLLDSTEKSFFKISEKNIRKNYADAKSIMKGTITELENKKLNSKDGITGIPSGFKDLDEVTGGWQKSELIIIAARPGMGKTAFVVSAMQNAAIKYKKPVAIFSLEMSATQLMLRMISAEAELEGESLRKGTLKQHEWQQLHHRIKDLSNSSIFIDDTPALSILGLRAKCRRLKAQHDIQMVIVDYLQLMTGDDGSGAATSREQEIAKISRSLKNLAKELDVPVIALSQLSRAVEIRGGDKRPQLSDLRESGSIEQDADMVLFLFRPGYYNLDKDEEGEYIENQADVIIAKNRSGVTDTIKLQFIKQFTKFVNIGEYKNEISPFSFAQHGSLDAFESQSSDLGLINTFKSSINKSAEDDDKKSGEEYPF